MMLPSGSMTTTMSIQPLQSAMAGGKKHKREDSETPSEESSQTTKRAKRVRFASPSPSRKEKVEVKLLGPPATVDAVAPNGKKKRTGILNSGVMFKKFVESALDEKAAGKNIHYEELRSKFQIDPARVDQAGQDVPSSSELRMLLIALTNVVSRLDQSCASLISDIVCTRWVGRDVDFVNTFARFLGTLVSAHSNYMFVITKMLVGNLGFLPRTAGRIPGYDVVDRKVIYDRVHYTLQYILDLVPTAAASTLFPALVSEFPHRSEKKFEHTRYLGNVLRVIEYVPALRNKILAVATDRVIKIDIGIQEDLDDEDDDMEAEILASKENISQMLDEDSEDEIEDEEDEEESNNRDSLAAVKETVDKLDCMLALMFNYYSNGFPKDGKAVTEPSCHSMQTFDLMLQLFNTTILPTHRTRYTQFLMFWVAQKSPEFSDRFCVSLFERATDAMAPVRARKAAASYLACYVARAKRMPKEDVRIIVRLLCRWLETFIKERSWECTGPDIKKWGGFYAVCQAMMYIFCFRFRDLKKSADGDDEDDEISLMQNGYWTHGLEVMNKVVVSKFNPLKVCTPLVVEMFAKIAHHLQFCFCFSIMEQNKRRGRRDEDVLDAYFPFDPCTLKKTRHWIDDIFNTWKPIPGLEDDEEGTSSDTIEDDEVEPVNQDIDVDAEDSDSDA